MKLVVFISIILCINGILKADNPLDFIVSDQVYKESKLKFSESKNIFLNYEFENSKKTDKDKVLKRLEDTFFKIVMSVKKDKENGYSAIMYCRNNDRDERVLINGEEKIEIDGYYYKVKPEKGKVTISDVKTGIKIIRKIGG